MCPESSTDSPGSLPPQKKLPYASKPPLPKKAYQSLPSILRFLIPALLGLSSDLWLKAWSFPEGVPAVPPHGAPPPAGLHPAEIFPHDSWPVIDHLLGFTTTVNHGAVFGIGQGMAFYFLLFSLLAMAMILWVFLTSRSTHWIVHLALGMITAGALGNLYDRASFNGVRDMLKLLCLVWRGKDYYPFIFNIADVMLCIGVPLLMLRWLFIKDAPPAVK